MTVLSALSTIIAQQQIIIARLSVLQASQAWCCGAGSVPVQMPPGYETVPLLPPVRPPLTQTVTDPVLCQRIQREIDNILDSWERVVEVVETAGAISASALIALVGTVLAPESGAVSLAIAAACATAVSTGIGLLGEQLSDTPTTVRQNAARAAYGARAAGSDVASDSALAVLRPEMVPPLDHAFALFWQLWGGLRRAFGSDDIGDYSGYPIICLDLYVHNSEVVHGSPVLERIYLWLYDSGIVMSSEVPGVTSGTGPTRYLRDLPVGTVIYNNSPATIGVAYWSYAGQLVTYQPVAPGGSFTVNVPWNGGYVSTPASVTIPLGTLGIQLPG